MIIGVYFGKLVNVELLFYLIIYIYVYFVVL